jgi:putative membrane protein
MSAQRIGASVAEVAGVAHPPEPETTADEISVELSSRRTGMSFQRTRMSADRTLMSVIRTAISLISFGFTIYQGFRELRESGAFQGRSYAPRNFGVTLVALGIVMLIIGIGYHAEFMRELRHTREELVEEGLVHEEISFPPSMTLVTAVLLLCIGIGAIWSMLAR